MRGGSRTCSWSTPAPSRTLRLRGKTRPCYNVIEVNGTHVAVWRRYPFHGQERIIQFDLDDARVREVHVADRARGDSAAVKAVALIDGEHCAATSSARRSLELPYEWVGAILVGGSGEAARRRDYGVPLLDELRRRRGRGRPLGRAGARRRRSASAGRRGRSPPGCSYVGADFRFDPPVLRASSTCRRSP